MLEVLHTIAAKGVEHGASDILLKVGRSPAFRIRGQLHYAQSQALTERDTRSLADVVLGKRGVGRSRIEVDMEESLRNDWDVSLDVPDVGRFRVNVYFQRGTLALAMRAIPHSIPSFDDLGVPQAVRNFAKRKRGLVLFAGAAGQGKTTTLAALMDYINTHARVHIVTVEDPIEFLHHDKLACVSQREVGIDTRDFASGLRAALRQAPDVILVGEIRDPETMDTALRAAETGHLVFATIHTPDVPRTVGRCLALMEGLDPQDARERLADNLAGVSAQRLVPGTEDNLVLASEVLVCTETARESIRSPRNAISLTQVLEQGRNPYGMQTFTMAFEELTKAGKVSPQVARVSIRP